ncbi:MAG: substrate-binding domain-containing protein, partial [Anaerolineae bacterium]|nr:substrate-binding domain-containing protein [Anaerolineae bacterium]
MMLAACGGNGEEADTDGKPCEDMYFRLVTHGGDDPFWAVVQQGMRDAADDLGCKADIDLAGGDLANQQKKFEEAVASKPDGIAVVINDDTAWDKPVADAIAAGIPVIGINNDDTEGSAGNARLAYIGQSERRAGYMMAYKVFSEAQAAGVDLAGAHVAMFAEVPGAAYATVRSAGVNDAMAEFGITSFELADAGGLEMTTVEARMTDYLVAHPETTFLLGAGGICTDRLMSALKAAGKAPGDVWAAGFDAAPGTVE